MFTDDTQPQHDWTTHYLRSEKSERMFVYLECILLDPRRISNLRESGVLRHLEKILHS